jgi:hypothetical protein
MSSPLSSFPRQAGIQGLRNTLILCDGSRLGGDDKDDNSPTIRKNLEKKHGLAK